MRFISVLLTAALPLIAQSQSGDLSVSGVVVNPLTGEPIKNALVTLNEIQVPKPAPDGTFQFQRNIVKKPKTTMSGPGGEFAFYGLMDERVMLSAQKPGFATDPKGAANQNFELKSSIGDHRIMLMPLGAIEGKVVDQFGEPLWGGNIVALQPVVIDGIRSYNTIRDVSTDDRGGYRLSGLQPGRYYIKVAGKSGTFRHTGGAPWYSTWESFVPFYAGGARDIANATPVEVGAGQNRTVDVALKLEPAFRIRGTLAGTGDRGVKFELVQGAEKVSASRASLNIETGRFEVQDVLPGDYLLRATRGTEERGEVHVSVRGEDVEGIALTMSPAVTVTGAVRFTGERPKVIRSAVDSFEPLDSDDEGSCRLSLRNREVLALVGAGEKQIAIQSVLPGEYLVDVECAEGYPISVIAGSQDLMRNPKYVVQPGVAPAPIEIQAKWGGGRIQGKLQTKLEAQEPDGLLEVLAVPASGAGGGQIMETAFQDPQSPNAEPGFSFSNLKPGDYVLYAFARQDIEFRNPAFIQTLSGGVTVHVEDNQETQVTLTKVISQ